MFKRKLCQDEEGLDRGEDEDILEGELSDDSTTSEEESETEQLTEETGGEDGRSSKTKVMILASRGVNARQRHMLDDLCLLMPHGKKESKFDTKRDLFALNELAELNGCSHVLFFESRKPQELFIWAAKSPSGPSVRFHVQNISTLEELHLTGNCMKNTRPILTFDPMFSTTEHGAIMKELLSTIFGVPKNHRKTRQYVDRLMHFGFADDRIWVRNYQLKEGGTVDDDKLVIDGLAMEEIGPRFILHPVRVLEGAFAGRTLWLNPNYTPAVALRTNILVGEAWKHKQRVMNQEATAQRKKKAILPETELDHVFD